MDKWAATVKVETQDFPFRRYFGPEGQALLSSFLGLFSKRSRQPARVPLTLGMLAEAMRRGRWNTADIEAAVGSRE
jgi:hypothetical protein